MTYVNKKINFKYRLVVLFSVLFMLYSWGQPKSILVEAESFNEKRMVIDQQSMDIMGSLI